MATLAVYRGRDGVSEQRPGPAALAAVTALAIAALGGGVAWAAEVIRASPLTNTYTAQTFDMAAGEIPTFTNGAVGGVPHDVAATARGPDGRFLFKISADRVQQIVLVGGTQYLTPGTYRFFCTVHGASMAANLRVGPGNPVPRPRLALTVPDQGLGAVRGSGKLRVKLADQGSNASGVRLEASVGRVKIATKRGVSVRAGASRQLLLSLTQRGRQLLQGRERAAVKVVASVSFAKPDTARRLLD